MLRKRLVTLYLETEGRPEDFDWSNLLSLGPNETVNVFEVKTVDS